MYGRAMFFVIGVVCALTANVFAWSGPTSAAPAGNVSAPVNVGTISQVKNGGLGVNSLAVFGSTYVQNKLGVGVQAPTTVLDVNGEMKVASTGALCQSVTEGAIRYSTSLHRMQYCNGTAWTTLITATDVTAQAPAEPIAHGSQMFTSSGSWQVPAGITSAKVMVVGGGGGDSGDSDIGHGGNGGFGQAQINGLTPGSVIGITVGGGGSYGPNGSQTSGGTSAFGGYAGATGGDSAYFYGAGNCPWCSYGSGGSGYFYTSGSNFNIGSYPYNYGHQGPVGQSGMVLVEY